MKINEKKAQYRSIANQAKHLHLKSLPSVKRDSNKEYVYEIEEEGRLYRAKLTLKPIKGIDGNKEYYGHKDYAGVKSYTCHLVTRNKRNVFTINLTW